LRRVVWLDAPDGAFINRLENAANLVGQIAHGFNPFANQDTLQQIRAITSAAAGVCFGEQPAQVGLSSDYRTGEDE